MHSEHERIFRNDLLNWRIAKLGTNPRAISRESKNTKKRLAQMTVVRATRGKNISVLKLGVLAEHVGLDPKFLLDFNLKPNQFHRAVVATGKSATNR